MEVTKLFFRKKFKPKFKKQKHQKIKNSKIKKYFEQNWGTDFFGQHGGDKIHRLEF